LSEEEKFWPCGCITGRKGNFFFIKPCSLRCEVYRIAIEESKKRGNILEVR